MSNIFRAYCLEIGDNGKAPDNNGKAFLCHCAMHANHIIEQRSCSLSGSLNPASYKTCKQTLFGNPVIKVRVVKNMLVFFAGFYHMYNLQLKSS